MRSGLKFYIVECTNVSNIVHTVLGAQKVLITNNTQLLLHFHPVLTRPVIAAMQQ